MTFIWIATGIVVLFGFMVFFGAPYVPSRKKYVNRAFDQLYKVGSKDVLVDVGSGDGIVLRMAAARGAVAVGYEINPVLVMIARLLSWRYKNITITFANFWQTQLPKGTTVVYVFAVSRDGGKLIDKMQREANRLGCDLKVICYGSPLPGRKADKMLDAYHLYTFRPLHSQKAQV